MANSEDQNEMPPNQDLHYLTRQNRSPGKGASLPTDFLISLSPSGRNHRSLSFQTNTAGTYIYKGSLYVMPSAKIANYCVAKFTSLMRARDLFTQLQVLVNACRFWHFISLILILERK